MSDPESNKSHAARTDSVSQSNLVRTVLARANKARLADAGLDADIPTIAGVPGINEIINTADTPRQDGLLLQQPVKSNPPIQDYEIPTPQQESESLQTFAGIAAALPPAFQPRVGEIPQMPLEDAWAFGLHTVQHNLQVNSPWPYQMPIVLVPVNLTQRLTHLTQRLREVIAEIPTQDQQRFIALSRTDQKAQLEKLVRLRHGRLEKWQILQAQPRPRPREAFHPRYRLALDRLSPELQDTVMHVVPKTQQFLLHFNGE
ncbi:hypothetical protein D6C83_04431 [Aureobasidium pullulans]|uniref:Uncharacterized protein n=1 Tax=Aureobasidium pullulans TaxID=5580 RepID=A0A4V6TLC0_AURPU|nr:hypothetical protein D6C83_04431 [Aureobasidium pullulans]